MKNLVFNNQTFLQIKRILKKLKIEKSVKCKLLNKSKICF